jgi:hypothetical protein
LSPNINTSSELISKATKNDLISLISVSFIRPLKQASAYLYVRVQQMHPHLVDELVVCLTLNSLSMHSSSWVLSAHIFAFPSIDPLNSLYQVNYISLGAHSNKRQSFLCAEMVWNNECVIVSLTLLISQMLIIPASYPIATIGLVRWHDILMALYNTP